MTSTDIVPAGPGAFGVEGLEDFDQNDMVMPTLRIGHNQDAGFFIDGLSGEKFATLEVVFLGLVKQRILWPPDLAETKEAPLCKSYDYSVGYPDAEAPARFPWTASGFSFDPNNPAPPMSCADCKLKEWGSHPKQDTPWCTEQHTFITLIKAGGGLSPAILTLQRTSLKPSKAYITSFARSKSPLFTVTTNLSLSVLKRGNVEYSVAVLTRGEPTDPELYSEFADQYRRIRAVLQTPRSGDPDEVPVAAPTTKPAAAPAASTTDTAPAQAAAPAAPIVNTVAPADDDLPF